MASNIKVISLYIDNMTCANCEYAIERALKGLAGIENVKASFPSGTVKIAFRPDIIDDEKIKEKIEALDYHVKLVKDILANDSKDANKDGSEAKVKNQLDLTDIIGLGIILFAVYVLLSRLGLTDFFNAFPIAREGMGYGMLFIIGLLTSVHCVAMCGGICLTQCAGQKSDNKDTASLLFQKSDNDERYGLHSQETDSKDKIALSSQKANKDKNLPSQTITTKAKASWLAAMKPSLLYNTGRVVSYTAIGAIVGAVGSVFSFSGSMKGIVQLAAGIFMIIMGLNMLNIFPALRRLNPRMPKVFAKKVYQQREKFVSPFMIGLLNGLMPCGPLQAMQLYALSTGEPVKGAFSMFLFSAGTFPLMFAFGALSSILSKKFTSGMMKAAAVLVLVLGVLMFRQGAALSGLILPAFPNTASSRQTVNIARIEDGIQIVKSGIGPGSYEPIIVQKGIPVRWIIHAEKGEINGCNNSIIIPKFNISQDLSEGDTIIEFMPDSSGTYSFSCWMGMIRSKIMVVDDLNNID